MTNKLQTGRIASISVAHMLNDWYMNLLPNLLPFMVAAGLGIGKGAFLISAFTTTSSLLQPVFGYLVDKKNQRWMVYVGTIWMAVLLSLTGLVSNYYALFALAVLSGLGTAAFHPQASAMISSVSGERKGMFQSVFAAAGNIGWALTPVIVIPFLQGYGLPATPLLVIPGLLAAVLLWFTAPKTAAMNKAVSPPLLPVLRKAWRELLQVVVLVACRSLTYFGLMSFLPLYLQTRHLSLAASGWMVSLMLLAGAAGGICGGTLSDRWGRKAVTVGSLCLATPFFYAFLYCGGWLQYVCLALAGAALLASFSVTVVLAQEILSKNAAMAAGLTLGFGIGVGGLGVGLVGVLIERMGMVYAIYGLISLPLAAGLAALAFLANGNAATRRRPDVFGSGRGLEEN